MIWLFSLLLPVLLSSPALLALFLTRKRPNAQRVRWTMGVQVAVLLVYLVYPPVSYWLRGGYWPSALTWYDGDGVLALIPAVLSLLVTIFVVMGAEGRRNEDQERRM